MSAERSNGVRIPLIIDTGLFVMGLIVASLMYADVNQLKADQVSESRVVALEQQLKFVNEKLTELKEQQREDTKRVVELITAERRRDRERP
jgi:hypothetical protein